ncbi:MAG: hypothetical protein HY665_09625 [Chloroflexi bacterium]|nr:hypothetical protein [Chloroflexota bacterium]
MKRLGKVVLALFIGSIAPLLIWTGAVSALYQKRKETKLDLACSIDSDCPPGFVCMRGRCVPAKT